jgi:hypothetical protein
MPADPFERLRELFPRTAPTQGDRAAARRRLLAMALSIAVAFVLWLTVNMRETYTITVESPLEVVSLPEGQALRDPVPRTVRVQYEGVGWDLLNLRRNPPDVPLYVDGPAVDLVNAAAESARLPLGVAVRSVQPAALELELDAAVTRRLPVRLTGDLDFAPGYGLLRPPRLDPDSVVVSGARSLVGGLRAWPTAPLALAGLRRSVSTVLPLSDTLEGLVRLSADRALVGLEVGQFTEGSRTLEVRVEGVPPGVSAVRLIPGRVRATYLVPIEGDHYERAEETGDFYAVVDYADIVRDTAAGTVPVRPHVPEGLPLKELHLEPRRLEYYTVRE